MDLGERFLIETFSERGVLLDLATGTYFRMNGPGRHVCEALLSTPSLEAAVAEVVQRLHISAEQAAIEVTEISNGLIAPVPRRTSPGPFSYRPDMHLYLQCFEDVPVLEIGPDGQNARVLPGAGERVSLEDCLRVAAPKLLVLQGFTVLHASACVVEGGLVAFCGLSGAGKTTTARAFSEAGWTAFCEDLIVIETASLSTPRPAAHALGEEGAHSWARATARSQAKVDVIDCSGLGKTVVADRKTIPLRTALFLANDRRMGKDIVLAQATPDGALVHLMECSFLASSSPSSWRQLFESFAAIARTVDGFVVSVPQGISSLADAARRYIDSSTS
jgi:hypothetical protein